MTSHQNLPDFILPETTDKALCFVVDGLLTTNKYEITGALFDQMLERQGEIRLLTLYKKFVGWEEAATRMDLGFSVKYGPHITRMAFVNPPSVMITQLKLRTPASSTCEIRYFNENEMQTALDWVNE